MPVLQCWLIISQMSDTRCELINWLILPLAAIVMASSLLSLGQLEVYLLWAYCCLVTGAHLHFGIHVVSPYMLIYVPSTVHLYVSNL